MPTKLFKKERDPNDVRINNYSVELVLRVPKMKSITVSNKYHDVMIEVPADRLSFEGFQCDLSVTSSIGELEVINKYGSVRLRDGRNADLQLFQGKFVATELHDVEMELKYSDFQVDKLHQARVESFQSDLEIGSFDRLDGNLKYSEIDGIESGSVLDISTFQCTIKAKSIGQLKVDNAKYSKFYIDKLDELNGDELFQSDFRFDALGSLDIEAKYTDIETELLTGNVRFDGFQNKIEADRLGDTTEKIHLEGNYLKAELPITLPYEADIELKNGSVRYMSQGEIKSATGGLEYRGVSHDNPVVNVLIRGFSSHIDLHD